MVVINQAISGGQTKCQPKLKSTPKSFSIKQVCGPVFPVPPLASFLRSNGRVRYVVTTEFGLVKV